MVHITSTNCLLTLNSLSSLSRFLFSLLFAAMVYITFSNYLFTLNSLSSLSRLVFSLLFAAMVHITFSNYLFTLNSLSSLSRLVFSLLFAAMVHITPSFKEADGSYPSHYYALLVFVYLLHQVSLTISLWILIAICNCTI